VLQAVQAAVEDEAVAEASNPAIRQRVTVLIIQKCIGVF